MVCEMKIIVVNKFYYNRGGDCTATLATERVLREHGHDVAVFAMDYPQNLPSQWQRYFAPQADFGGSPGKRLRALGRLFSPWDVRRAFTRLLDDFRPDVVHLNNIHSYLSPVVAEVAHARGVRVVWTMHDYKAVCPSYVCLRGGQVCTECMGGTSGVVRHRCMKGSLLQSTFAWLESLWWGRKRLARATDCFIAPSEFVRQMLLRGGFAAGQVVTVPHCVPRRPGVPPVSCPTSCLSSATARCGASWRLWRRGAATSRSAGTRTGRNCRCWWAGRGLSSCRQSGTKSSVW